jgi:hypothetical protein
MKKTVRSDYQLIISPETFIRDGFSRRGITDEELAERCEEIKAAINRHVDGVAGVRIKFASYQACSFCGHEWSEITKKDLALGPPYYDEHSIPGEPGCCDEAIAEFRAKRGIPQADA